MSRAGRKAFKRCSVKEVEFKYYSVDPDTGSYILPESRVERKIYSFGGYRAILHCPRVEDSSHTAVTSKDCENSQIKALKDVEILAGELLCKYCMFSSMGPVAIAQHRTALANAETERIEAFAELAKARKNAISELDSTDMDFLLEQQAADTPAQKI